jgi:hypothetical protein
MRLPCVQPAATYLLDRIESKRPIVVVNTDNKF